MKIITLVLALVLVSLSHQHDVKGGSFSGAFSSSSSSSQSSSSSSSSSGSFRATGSLNEVGSGFKDLVGKLAHSGASAGSGTLGYHAGSGSGAGASGSGSGTLGYHTGLGSGGLVPGSGSYSTSGAGAASGSTIGTGTPITTGPGGLKGEAGHTGSTSGVSTLGSSDTSNIGGPGVGLGGLGSGTLGYHTGFGAGGLVPESGSYSTSGAGATSGSNIGTGTPITTGPSGLKEEAGNTGRTSGASSLGSSATSNIGGSAVGLGGLGSGTFGYNTGHGAGNLIPGSGSYSGAGGINGVPITSSPGGLKDTENTGSTSGTSNSGTGNLDLNGGFDSQEPSNVATFPNVASSTSGGTGSGNYYSGVIAPGKPSIEISGSKTGTSGGFGAGLSGSTCGIGNKNCGTTVEGVSGSTSENAGNFFNVLPTTESVNTGKVEGDATLGSFSTGSVGSTGQGFHVKPGGTYSSEKHCCNGPFPGPAGSIHESKLASSVPPINPAWMVSHPSGGSYKPSGSSGVASSTGGATTDTSKNAGCCNGPFPGPAGSIHDYKPASSVPALPNTNNYVGTKPQTLPGPSGSIHESRPISSFPGTGSHIYGPSKPTTFPGPSGSIHEVKPIPAYPSFSGYGNTNPPSFQGPSIHENRPIPAYPSFPSHGTKPSLFKPTPSYPNTGPHIYAGTKPSSFGGSIYENKPIIGVIPSKPFEKPSHGGPYYTYTQWNKPHVTGAIPSHTLQTPFNGGKYTSVNTDSAFSGKTDLATSGSPGALNKPGGVGYVPNIDTIAPSENVGATSSGSTEFTIGGGVTSAPESFGVVGSSSSSKTGSESGTTNGFPISAAEAPQTPKTEFTSSGGIGEDTGIISSEKPFRVVPSTGGGTSSSFANAGSGSFSGTSDTQYGNKPAKNDGFAAGSVQFQKPDGAITGANDLTNSGGNVFSKPGHAGGALYSNGGAFSGSNSGFSTGSVQIKKPDGSITSGGNGGGGNSWTGSGAHSTGNLSPYYGFTSYNTAGGFGGNKGGSGFIPAGGLGGVKASAGASSFSTAGGFGGVKGGGSGASSFASAGSSAGSGFKGVLGDLFGKQGLGGNLGYSGAGSWSKAHSFASSSSYAGASSGSIAGHY